MKKLLSLALACTLTLGLASCGGTGTSTSSNAPASSSAVESPAAQFDAASYLSGDYPKLPEDGPAYSLSIGHAMQESTESHKMLLALKDAVEKYSDGKITITIYPNSQLGSDSEMIASCVAGDMDMVLQCGSTHATFVPETVIFDIPFLFSGYDSEKIESVLTDSKFRDLYNQANEDDGLVCLMLRAGTDSMNLTSNKPVTSMEDLKGLKIRTAQVESRMAVWNALGANPTPMAFNELYMALQNRTVDAQDNNLSNALSSALYEVQEYLVPTHHMTPSMDLTMNKDKFYSMPQSYQDLLTAICEDMSAYDYDVCIAMEQYYYDSLVQEHGMQVCEITDEFLTDMQTAAAPAVESAKAAVGNDALYDTLYQLLDGGESA